MKKTILILIFLLMFTSNINAEWRTGMSIDNYGYGLKLIEYLQTDNYSDYSLYIDSKVDYENSNSIIKLGHRRYLDKNDGFFADLSLILQENTSDLEEYENGFGIGGGYVYQLSRERFISLDGGYTSIGREKDFYFGASLDFSWTHYRRGVEEEREELTQIFLNKHPNISKEAKEHLKENTPKDRMEYINDNPNLDGEIKSRLILNKIWIGMSYEKAKLVLGEPNDINRTTTAYGVREQWVYGGIENRRYYYFEDRVLTSWQN